MVKSPTGRDPFASTIDIDYLKPFHSAQAAVALHFFFQDYCSVQHCSSKLGTAFSYRNNWLDPKTKQKNQGCPKSIICLVTISKCGRVIPEQVRSFPVLLRNRFESYNIFQDAGRTSMKDLSESENIDR